MFQTLQVAIKEKLLLTLFKNESVSIPAEKSKDMLHFQRDVSVVKDLSLPITELSFLHGTLFLR